jgi:hypothetical protein
MEGGKISTTLYPFMLMVDPESGGASLYAVVPDQSSVTRIDIVLTANR